MSFRIVVTDGFKKQLKGLAKKYPSIKSDLTKLLDSLEKTPAQGEALGKDCFKIRMAIKYLRVKENPVVPELLPVSKYLRKLYISSPFMTSQKRKIFLIKNWINFYK